MGTATVKKHCGDIIFDGGITVCISFKKTVSLRLSLTKKGANVQESLWSREIIQGV